MSFQLRYGIEFWILALVCVGVVARSLATGKTFMKAPFSVSRETDPILYWMELFLYGLLGFICLYAAMRIMPIRVFLNAA